MSSFRYARALMIALSLSVSYNLLFQAKLTAQQNLQQPIPTTPLFKIETHAVTLDVVVTGKHNAPLAGLKKEDFTLLEDGKPQTIADFGAIDMQSSGKQILQRLAPRTIIVFDEVLGSFVDLASARQELHKFFNRNNGQLAQPTMLYALTADGLVRLQGYTRDGHALDVALHQHRTYESPCNFGRCWYVLPTSSPDVAVSPVEALKEIAMSELPTQTHKTILWLTTGVPTFIPPNLIPADLQLGIYNDVRHMSDLLRRARITLYTIDTSGVAMDGIHVTENQNIAEFAAPALDSSGSTFSDLTPQTLAIQSGGRAIFGRNDTASEIEECVTEGDVYYSLLYYPTDPNFNGKFRRITVKVDRPGYDVQTRNGYYAMPNPLELSALDVQRELANAERSPFHYIGVPIVLTRTKLTRPPEQASIRVYIDISSVQWKNLPDGTMQASLDIAAVDFAGPDKPIHAVSNQVNINIPQSSETPGNDHLFKVPVNLDVTLPNGYIRVIVRDNATGQLGSSNITDLTKLPVYPHENTAYKTQ